MGSRLLAEDADFRAAVSECDEAAAPFFSRPLRDFLCGSGEHGGCGYRSAALAAFMVATGKALTARGAKPGAYLGCSIGEIAALILTGTIAAADAFRFLAAQAAALEETAVRGDLLFALGEADLAETVKRWADAEVAGSYGPGLLTIAVGSHARDAVCARLAGIEAMVQPLSVGCPVHSSLIDKARDSVLAAGRQVAWRNMELPIFSAATGNVAECEAEYFWRIVRAPITFDRAICAAADHGFRFAIDIGPSGSLASAARRAVPGGINACPAIMPIGGGADALDAATLWLERMQGQTHQPYLIHT